MVTPACPMGIRANVFRRRTAISTQTDVIATITGGKHGRG